MCQNASKGFGHDASGFRRRARARGGAAGWANGAIGTAMPPLAKHALAAFILSSCATTELTQTWRDPTYSPAPVRQVLVIAITPRERYREAFEAEMAKAFAQRGVLVATAVHTFPGGRPGKAQVAAYVKAEAIDLVVMQRIVKRTTLVYSPGASYIPENANSDWYYFWDTSTQSVSGPDEYSGSAEMLAQTSVYAMRTRPDAPIWSGDSTTFDFQNARSAAASLEASLVEKLASAGILAK